MRQNLSSCAMVDRLRTILSRRPVLQVPHSASDAWFSNVPTGRSVVRPSHCMVATVRRSWSTRQPERCSAPPIHARMEWLWGIDEAVSMPSDVETLMTAWQDAWFTKNARAIADMMNDDYIYVPPNGAVMDRATILGVVDDPTYALTDGTHTETVVSMLGEDAAMVRRRWQGKGTYRGQAFVEDHRCVTICDRTSGRWRIRYEQCSAVAA